MNLEQALKPIAPVVGFSSLIGAPESISFKRVVEKITLKDIQDKMKKLNKSIEDCKSDYAYWGYAGQLSYWKAVENIFKASEIVGRDNLPDVVYNDTSAVVMDKMSDIEAYGKRILELSKERGKK